MSDLIHLIRNAGFITEDEIREIIRSEISDYMTEELSSTMRSPDRGSSEGTDEPTYDLATVARHTERHVAQATEPKRRGRKSTLTEEERLAHKKEYARKYQAERRERLKAEKLEAEGATGSKPGLDMSKAHTAKSSAIQRSSMQHSTMQRSANPALLTHRAGATTHIADSDLDLEDEFVAVAEAPSEDESEIVEAQAEQEAEELEATTFVSSAPTISAASMTAETPAQKLDRLRLEAAEKRRLAISSEV